MSGISFLHLISIILCIAMAVFFLLDVLSEFIWPISSGCLMTALSVSLLNSTEALCIRNLRMPAARWKTLMWVSLSIFQCNVNNFRSHRQVFQMWTRTENIIVQEH